MELQTPTFNDAKEIELIPATLLTCTRIDTGIKIAVCVVLTRNALHVANMVDKMKLGMMATTHANQMHLIEFSSINVRLVVDE